MKISITKLETARKNPKAFVAAVKAGENSQSFGGRAKYIRFQDSINHFNKTNDFHKTVNYFNNSFSQYVDNTKNRKDQERYFNSLNDYVNEFKKKKFEFVKKENLKIELTERVMITGQIPMTFKNNKGECFAYFFAKDSEDWENELRFPIVQNYFRDIFKTELNNIHVGIFNISKNKFQEISFPEKEILKAEKELKTIGNIIHDVL